MNRQGIRQMLVEGVENVSSSIYVTTERHIENLRDVLPFCSIIIENVSIESDLARQPQFNCSVDMTVIIDDTYDVLDVWIDDIIDSVIANVSANYRDVGCILQQIVYLTDFDSGVNGATLTWTTHHAR